MTDQKPMLVYTATHDSVPAAETDLDAIEQLHKDQVIGTASEAGLIPEVSSTRHHDMMRVTGYGQRHPRRAP